MRKECRINVYLEEKDIEYLNTFTLSYNISEAIENCVQRNIPLFETDADLTDQFQKIKEEYAELIIDPSDLSEAFDLIQATLNYIYKCCKIQSPDKSFINELKKHRDKIAKRGWKFL